MSTYTKTPSSSDIVFLNDSNIVHDISTDVSNAIASQTLVNELSNTIADTYVSANDAKMTDASASNLIADNATITNFTATNATILTASISTLTAGNLTANGEIQASALNISGAAGTVNVATVNATTQISVQNDAFIANTDGSVSAKNLSVSKISAQTALNVADKISANANGIYVNGVVSSSSAIRANDISANRIFAASTAVFSPSGIRIGDSSTTNKLYIDNDELNILVPIDSGNPKLKINGKRFTDYYEGYLSDGYLDDVIIEKPNSGEYINISCLKFTWNDDSGKADKLIPLSALGGIYDVADGDTIIKIIKTDANSFKVSADEDAISSLIKDALSAEFGIQDAKDELSNKIKFRNGENVSRLTSLTIRKITAAEYKALGQADKDANDVIYVIDENDMDMFNSRITNLGAPAESADAATKNYVDSTIDAAKVTLSGNLSFASDPANTAMQLKLSNDVIASFDYSTFIKDGMLSNVEVVDSSGLSVLKFTFNTDGGTHAITVPLTSLAEVYSQGTYTTISPSVDPHNTTTIDVNITAVQQAIDSSIRNNIVEDNLSVLNKHDSTNGSWNAPAAGSPLALLSGAISNAIKADVISEDNTISAALSGTVSNTYVSADALQQNAANGTGVFGTYAKKADYVSNDALSGTANGILRNYYTIAQLKGEDGYSPALSSVYQLAANMTNYPTTVEMNTAIANCETVSNVDNLITNLSAGVSGLSNGIAVIADNALGGSNDLSILSAKVNELVSAMNIIIDVLSGVSKTL